MKKIILIISLLSFFSTPIVKSQVKSNKVDIAWGEKEKRHKRTSVQDVIGSDEGGFYVLKTFKESLLKNGLTIDYYDYNLNVKKTIVLNLHYEDNAMAYEYIIELKGKFYLFTSYLNKKTDKNYLFVQSIDMETLEKNADITKIAEVEIGQGWGHRNSGSFDYSLSTDKSKLLVYYNTAYEKNENQSYGLQIYNDDMDLLWNDEVSLDIKDRFFSVESYIVDNLGNVHLVGIEFEERTSAFDKENGGYTYKLISYFDEGEEEIKCDIEMDDKFIMDMKVAVNNNQDIICSGFYSNKNASGIAGSFYLKIDSEKAEITESNYKEFDLNFITQNMTEAQKKRAEKREEKGRGVEMYDYVFDELILKEDGGAILVGEQFYIRVVTTRNSNGGTSTTYYYYFNDIIVINISAEGEILWTQKIAKRQTTKNDYGYYSSYVMTVVGDDLYFVFNDNPKNLFYNGEGKLKVFAGQKNTVTVLVTIDSGGEKTKEALFTTKESGVFTRPMASKQISENTTIVIGRYGKTFNIAKFTFK